MQFIGANGFEEFINGNGIWIIIGCLGVAFIVSVVFLVLNIVRAKKIRAEQEQEFISGENSEYLVQLVEEEVQPVKETSEITKPVIATYNITQDEKTKEWVVKKVGATRATRRCSTKKEAEELVKKLTK